MKPQTQESQLRHTGSSSPRPSRANGVRISCSSTTYGSARPSQSTPNCRGPNGNQRTSPNGRGTTSSSIPGTWDIPTIITISVDSAESDTEANDTIVIDKISVTPSKASADTDPGSGPPAQPALFVHPRRMLPPTHDQCHRQNVNYLMTPMNVRVIRNIGVSMGLEWVSSRHVTFAVMTRACQSIRNAQANLAVGFYKLLLSAGLLSWFYCSGFSVFDNVHSLGSIELV